MGVFDCRYFDVVILIDFSGSDVLSEKSLLIGVLALGPRISALAVI